MEKQEENQIVGATSVFAQKIFLTKIVGNNFVPIFAGEKAYANGSSWTSVRWNRESDVLSEFGCTKLSLCVRSSQEDARALRFTLFISGKQIVGNIFVAIFAGEKTYANGSSWTSVRLKWEPDVLSEFGGTGLSPK